MDNPIWSYIFGPPKEKKDLMKLLGGLPVFESLSQREVVQIERLLHERQYRKDELVFNEGEPGAAMYVVQKGEVVITKKIGGENSIELARIGESNFFGELALLDETPRSASAHAAADTHLLAFAKPDLEKLIERIPRLGAKVLGNLSRLVSQRLLKANENLEVLQNKLNSFSQGDRRET